MQKPPRVNVPFQGGCVCGAVRYEVTARPLMMFRCHCRTCQIVSGGPYVPVVLVPIDGFKLTKGTIRFHDTERIDGKRHKRGFCGDCGSRLTGGERIGEPSRWIGLTASSMDHPEYFKAQSDIFVTHAQPWDLLDPATPKYSEYPPPLIVLPSAEFKLKK